MLTLTTAALRQRLLERGVPAWNWAFADDTYRTVAADYPAAVWAAWIESLRANAPQLLESRHLGGGLTRTVPRHIPEAGDCENHSLLCMGHALMGNWIAAAQGGPRTGLAFGLLHYTATPRPENRHREGGHAQLWFCDHAGELRTYECGDGELSQLTPAEWQSAIFGYAA